MTAVPATAAEHERLGALLDLVRSDLSVRGDAVRRIVETAGRVLGVNRVGLWFYTDDRAAIEVEDLYETASGVHRSGDRLSAGDFPRYFDALAESRVIAANDAKTDPRTSELAASYLGPLDVCSMLDVPVRSEGRVVGVLCHEHIGSLRRWTAGEEEFAGTLADLVGTVVEASRRRRTEEELRELASSLELRVAERTADLEKSNRDLVRAVGDLEAFCYSVSHDLRAPLRVINGFASMLESSALAAADGEASLAASRIRENTNRMSDLLDGLLAFFRLGRRPMKVERVDMDGLYEATLEALGVAGSAGVLRAGPLAAVRGDRALLADVLGNLVSNGIKFSSRRQDPRVEVSCERDGGEAVFCVRDNGIGFREDHASRLFEPFQRLHARDGYDGTGVGLAIVRRIVERHGGRVWAESQPGRGATFRFALPAAD